MINVVVEFTGQRGRITTERAASSYGQPVVVVDGESAAAGPGEIGRLALPAGQGGIR